MVNKELLRIMISMGLPRDYSLENQKSVLEMVMVILRINREVMKKGIGILEDYISGYPLLDRGLQLIRMGLEPELIENLLFNAVIANNMDLLTGLVTLEGIYSIQTVQLPQITMEVLKSHFPFAFVAEFEEKIVESNLNINRMEINRQEVEKLISGQMISTKR